jgi:hypothetical protein
MGGVEEGGVVGLGEALALAAAAPATIGIPHAAGIAQAAPTVSRPSNVRH